MTLEVDVTRRRVDLLSQWDCVEKDKKSLAMSQEDARSIKFLSLSLSILTAIFPDGPELAGTRLSPFWLPAGFAAKSAFSPRRGDSLHRFTWNLAQPRGTWVRLVMRNFTPIGARGSVWSRWSVAVTTMRRQSSRIAAFLQADARPMFVCCFYLLFQLHIICYPLSGRKVAIKLIDWLIDMERTRSLWTESRAVSVEWKGR